MATTKANDTIKLAEGWALVPEGEVVLTIKSASAKPKANPSVIEIVFAHESGAEIRNKYELSNQMGLVALSYLARCIMGNDTENMSISKDLPTFVGKKVLCEVVHKEGSKGGTFANIAKTISLVEDDAQDDIDEEDDI